MNGEHLWLETNVSGDLCYLGEESCQVKFSVSYFWISFSLSEVTSLASDWCSAQSLESLDCLPVFQKESKKGKKLLVKTLLLQEKSPNQFWLTQIIYTVRMYVMNSFTNVVREKRVEYWDGSGILKDTSLFYIKIYANISLVAASERRVWSNFCNFNHCKGLNWIFQTLECTHWQWVHSYLSVYLLLFGNIQS